MFTNASAVTIDHFGAQLGSQAEARRIAGKLFDRAHERGVRGQWWAKLSGKDNRLRTLPRSPKAARQTLALAEVALDSIVGSEDRSEDFDAAFNPLKTHNRERWISVAAARRMGVVLPVVELVQAGDKYYVRDGHHRISVARALGQLEIEAKIVNV